MKKLTKKSQVHHGSQMSFSLGLFGADMASPLGVFSRRGPVRKARFACYRNSDKASVSSLCSVRMCGLHT